MKKQVSTILLKTIDQLFYQIDKTGLAARKVIEQPISPNVTKTLVSEIVQRYFNDIQKNVVKIPSLILSVSNLWESFFSDLKKGIENNDLELVTSGIKILKKEHLNKLERYHEINEILQEYLNKLHHYTLDEDDLNHENYKSFIQQIEQLVNIINSWIISWENWIESFHCEYKDLLKEIEKRHLIWLEINDKIKTTHKKIII